MSMNGVGRKAGYDPLGAGLGKIDKVGIGQTQAGGAGASAEAGAAGAVAGVDVRKIAGEVAQTLGAAADKFRMLSQVNPFSQKAGLMMDMLAKGQETIKEALDDWGKFLREQAAKDKESDLKSQLKNQPIKQAEIKNEDIQKRFDV